MQNSMAEGKMNNYYMISHVKYEIISKSKFISLIFHSNYIKSKNYGGG